MASPLVKSTSSGRPIKPTLINWSAQNPLGDAANSEYQNALSAFNQDNVPEQIPSHQQAPAPRPLPFRTGGTMNAGNGGGGVAPTYDQTPDNSAALAHLHSVFQQAMQQQQAGQPSGDGYAPGQAEYLAQQQQAMAALRALTGRKNG